ncbi:MAG: phosphoglycerate mutase family protein [Candidatus Nanoarchaeia archaeon]
MVVTQITFIRHGEAKKYKKNDSKYPGPGLTKKGILQAKKTGKYLSSFKFNRIYCSDMIRAIETAKEIKKYQKCKISYHRELAEVNKIIYESKVKDRGKLKTNIKRAESALEFFRMILVNNKNKKILIVAHGNAIRALIGVSLNFKLSDAPHLGMNNCAISTLFFNGKKLVGMPHIGVIDHHSKHVFKKRLEESYRRLKHNI